MAEEIIIGKKRESGEEKITLLLETQVLLETYFGGFYCCLLQDSDQISAEHLFLWQGNWERWREKQPLVRIHSECFTGEVLHSKHCDCRGQLDGALQSIAEEGEGCIIYLRQEGRGIGLQNKLKAYQLQQKKGLDTMEANWELGFESDLREYHAAVGVLKQLNLKKVRLMTNNPNKIEALAEAGFAVERVPLQVEENPHNAFYLKTKREKGGHLLDG